MPVPIFIRQDRPAIVGMIHLGALPGTPRSAATIEQVIAQAAAEARLYADAGLDAVLIENMHDVPYLKGRVGPEIVAAMTATGLAVAQAGRLPLGVQVLAGANRAAIAVALACGAKFVRVENFAYAHVADEGLMPTASAGPLLRYRRKIGAESVAVFADVKKKHAAHAITADVGLADAVRTADFCGADAVILTGMATGLATAATDVEIARGATRLPVCVGSGVTAENVHQYAAADVLLIGSTFKYDGDWNQAVDAARVRRFMDAAKAVRRI